MLHSERMTILKKDMKCHWCRKEMHAGEPCEWVKAKVVTARAQNTGHATTKEVWKPVHPLSRNCLA